MAIWRSSVPQQPPRIQARFTVPALQCATSGGIQDATVKVSALSGSSRRDSSRDAGTGRGAVAGSGLVTVSASIMAGCLASSSLYQAQALGKPLPMTISPGDTVLLTAFFDPAGSSQRQMATVHDITTGVTRSQTREDTGTFEPFSAFAGVQRSGREPIPDFGAIHWSAAKVNGAPIGSAPTLFGFNLVASVADPRLLIRTSSLAPSRDSFTNTWVAGS